VPPDALISGFSIAAGATTPVVFGTWGQSIFGGTYVYPTTVPACGTGTVSAYPLTQTVADGNWNIQGTVDAYSGLGLWWECNTATAHHPPMQMRAPLMRRLTGNILHHFWQHRPSFDRHRQRRTSDGSLDPEYGGT